LVWRGEDVVVERKLLFLRGVVEEECGKRGRVWDNQGTDLDVAG